MEYLLVVELLEGVEENAVLKLYSSDLVEAYRLVVHRVSKYQGAVRSWTIYRRDASQGDGSLEPWLPVDGYLKFKAS